MQRYAPDTAERATRDVVSRAAYLEVNAGRACKEGGVHIVASHLGPEFVEKTFPGMCARCRQFGYDLARGPVPVSPTAHFFMGGARIDKHCRASLGRLFVAGEDSGGVHGGNRLGGNGICDSCVYGRQAGKSLARFVRTEKGRVPETAPGMAEDLAARFLEPLRRAKGESPYPLRDAVRELNWTKVGIVRNGPDLESALEEMEAIREEARGIRISGPPANNMPWNVYLDLLSMMEVSRLVILSALARKESRAAHYRSDFPEQDDENGTCNFFLTRGEDGRPQLAAKPVAFTHKSLKECQQYRK